MADLPALTETIASTATIKLVQLPESTFFCTPIEERFERITRLARQALQVPVAAITFLNEEKQWFKSVVGWNVTELPNAHSFCPITLAAGTLTVIEDTQQDARVQRHPLSVSGPRFRFYAGLPMFDEHDNLCGTFCILDQKPRQLTAQHRETLIDLAAMAQREVVSEQLRSVHFSLTSKLGIARREAMMDPLTRLWNRRGASVLIRAALDTSRQNRSAVAVALLDLDNFKRINDSYGHQTGDEVLRKAAQRLVQNVRVHDSICRVGGDEFLLLMRDTDADVAAETAERVRRGMTATPIRTRQGAIALSTSVGYAVHSEPAEISVEELIARADKALMQSKSEGRDRVAIFA